MGSGVDLDGDAVVIASHHAVDGFDAEHPRSLRIAQRPLLAWPPDHHIVETTVGPRRVVDVRVGLRPCDAWAVADLLPCVGPDAASTIRALTCR